MIGLAACNLDPRNVGQVGQGLCGGKISQEIWKSPAPMDQNRACWGMNPDVLIGDDLAAGRLVPLIPGTALDIALHWQVARITATALKPLTRAIRDAAAKALAQG